MAATPEPTPTVTVVPVPANDTLDRILGVSTAGAVVLALAVALVLLSAGLIAWAILRSAKLPPPTALITALSLLSLFAVAGGIATNNDAAWTIAAAGVGALASSVSNIFQQGKYTPDQVEKAVAVVQEIERREAPPPPPRLEDEEDYGA
jgi:hypothetical protein